MTNYKFSAQYIASEWRDGRDGTAIVDIDPYTSELIDTFPAASLEDVDAAYRQQKPRKVTGRTRPLPSARKSSVKRRTSWNAAKPVLTMTASPALATRPRVREDRPGIPSMTSTRPRSPARYQGCGLPLADLVVEANLDLVIAVSKVWPHKDYPLIDVGIARSAGCGCGFP
jgi:hypothetical protein